MWLRLIFASVAAPLLVVLAFLLLCAVFVRAEESAAEAERIARLESRLEAVVKATQDAEKRTQEAEERRAEWERWVLGVLVSGVATGAGALIRGILAEPRRRRALREMLSVGDDIRRSGDDIRRTIERVESAGFIDPMPRLIVAPSPILTEGRIHLGPLRQMPPLIRPR